MIVFRRDGNAWLTAGGAAVTIPAPVTLAPPGFVETIVNRFQPPASFTAVGYGTGEAHNKPGEGGNKGGAVNDPSKLGVRWQTSQTSAFSYMGKNSNLLLASQNPARGNEGACGGDSGGPLFHGWPERHRHRQLGRRYLPRHLDHRPHRRPRGRGLSPLRADGHDA